MIGASQISMMNDFVYVPLSPLLNNAFQMFYQMGAPKPKRKSNIGGMIGSGLGMIGGAAIGGDAGGTMGSMLGAGIGGSAGGSFGSAFGSMGQ